MTGDVEVRFLVAAASQVGEVLAVLDEAAAWLQRRGVEQWRSRFDLSWVEGAPVASSTGHPAAPATGWTTSATWRGPGA